MSIMTVTTRIRLRYLENKKKSDLAQMYLDLLDDNEKETNELRVALRGMQQAADEIAIEFIQHKRATNWGIVNDAYVETEKLLRKSGS